VHIDPSSLKYLNLFATLSLRRITDFVGLEPQRLATGDISFVLVDGTEEEQVEFDRLASMVSFPPGSMIRRCDLLELVTLRVRHLFVGISSG